MQYVLLSYVYLVDRIILIDRYFTQFLEKCYPQIHIDDAADENVAENVAGGAENVDNGAENNDTSDENVDISDESNDISDDVDISDEHVDISDENNDISDEA